ncbi:MAG TPA: hypothetical protein VK539_23475 [Myxococcaceae bacterium]|nr:hypothetical protein [Myxococcaceae bacterium]
MRPTLDEGIARGTLAVTSGTGTELTGSPPQSVPAYLSAHRAELLAAPGT